MKDRGMRAGKRKSEGDINTCDGSYNLLLKLMIIFSFSIILPMGVCQE